ncbi:MAG TPA: hypothetical protein VF525_04680 [Pyrinomonadaceae bacterium]|jgi:hypothetical protein
MFTELTTTLYRTTGRTEVTLIGKSDYRKFPPRLSDQPTFQAMLSEEYALKIARDWQMKYSADGFAYVVRFRVRSMYLSKFVPRTVGGAQHREYWIPARELYLLNRNIVGLIEVIAEFIAPRL